MCAHEITSATDAPKVLLVDDDVDLCESLVEGLLREGVHASFVTSAAAALMRLVTQPDIGIVVTDIMMPEMSGLELLRKLSISRRDPPLAAIVMTGAPSLETAVAALRLSAVEFLQKPVAVSEVASAVRAADARRAAMRETTGEALPARTTSSYPEMIEWLRHVQHEREGMFPQAVMNETCWNMLLHLADAELEGRPVLRTELYSASGAATATALRRLDDLLEAGLAIRTFDPHDKRRAYVELTAQGSQQIRALVAGLLNSQADTVPDAETGACPE